MTPTQRTKARAFAIWRHANPRDWNVTYEEIAETTGMTAPIVAHVIHQMGWQKKVNYSRRPLAELEAHRARNNDFAPDLTQIFRTADLTSAQEFVNDWG